MWSNSDTTSSFASQTVTLSSNDYDELEFYYRYSTSTNNVACSKTLKGYNAFCTFATCLSGGASVLRRIAIYVSDTSYTFTSGEQATGATASSTDNTVIIPVSIYGIKF